jgi:hypothetical protein
MTMDLEIVGRVCKACGLQLPLPQPCHCSDCTAPAQTTANLSVLPAIERSKQIFMEGRLRRDGSGSSFRDASAIRGCGRRPSRVADRLGVMIDRVHLWRTRSAAGLPSLTYIQLHGLRDTSNGDGENMLPT